MSQRTSSATGKRPWLVVRHGHYRYLRAPSPLWDSYTAIQSKAMRFPTRKAAEKAIKNWEACWSSSWPCRAVQLMPPFRERVIAAVEPLMRLDDDADGGDFSNAGYKVRENLKEILR